ncbi:MAG: outer membrane protein assembly factor BamD [Sedimentisphaerales bacterium]
MRKTIIIFECLSLVITALLLQSCAAPARPATVRLDQQGQWKPTDAAREEQYLLRVAEMKKLVDAGKPGKVRDAIKQMKKDYPEIAGADFNSFTEGELLLAKGKITNAVRQYDKFLDDYPVSPLRDAALQREFDIASEFLAGRKKTILVFRVHAYDDGVKIMEKISDRTGSAEIAKSALLAVAHSYEKRKKYEEAYLTWSQISSRWPTGQTGKDALLAMARDKYATFNGPLYDASGLVSAKSYYENYKLRYPDDAQRIGVDEILAKINEQMAEKNLLVANYYKKTGQLTPANVYYQLVVDTWPDTAAAKTARQEIGKTK